MRSIVCTLLLFAAGCRPTSTPEAPVVIIGAGAAGLSTAYGLQKHGIVSHVLEAQNVVGGRIATATYAPEKTGEYGMQELWEDNPLVAIARDLNVPLDGSESPFSSVILDGRVERFQGDTTDDYFAGLFDPPTHAALDAWRAHAADVYKRARQEGLRDKEVQHLQDISLADWVRESKLPPRAQAWLVTTIEVELAALASETSALAALLDMEMFFGEGMACHHVRGGNSHLLDVMAHSLRGPVTMNATATAVHKTGSGFMVRYEQDHHVRTLHAERVVVAVPFVRLHQIDFDPPLSGDVWNAVNGLRLGQYAVVHFFTDPEARKLWAHDGGSPFPVLAGPQLGAIYGTLRQGITPTGDLFGVLLYGPAARAFHMAPRDAKITEIKYGLDALWPGFAKHAVDAAVYTHHPTALPVWPPGRSAIDASAQALRSSQGGVYLVGDYTHGAHATGAAESGLEAAQTIAHELQQASR